MKIIRIDHITINVKDIAKSLEFYKSIFDLKQTGRVDMGDHVLTYMDINGCCKLELIEYKFMNKSINAGETDSGIYRHAAFEVEDMDEIERRCGLHRVNVKLNPVQVVKLHCRAMLIEDPNGVEIELVERPAGTF